jgi:hypothetical protein
MSDTTKIINSNGFNEGGGVLFTTPTGVSSVYTETTTNRTDLPGDGYRYGIDVSVQITAGAATQLLASGIPNRQFEILSYTFVCDAASTVTFKSDSTVIAGPFAVAANGGVATNTSDDSYLFVTEPGEALNITNTAGNIGGHLTYRIV